MASALLARGYNVFFDKKTLGAGQSYIHLSKRQDRSPKLDGISLTRIALCLFGKGKGVEGRLKELAKSHPTSDFLYTLAPFCSYCDGPGQADLRISYFHRESGGLRAIILYIINMFSAVEQERELQPLGSRPTNSRTL